MKSTDLLMIAATVIAIGTLYPAVIEARKRRNALNLSTWKREVNFADAEREISARVEQEYPVASPVLHLTPGIPLRIVVGRLPHVEQEPLRNSVAVEDFKAALAVATAASSDHLHAQVVTVDDLERPCQDNLALIGSGRRNPLVKDFLTARSVKEYLDCDFVSVSSLEEGKEREEWGIKLKNKVYLSPLFKQERLLEKDPHGYGGGLMDYGLLALAPSPWNPDARVLVVAGTRALGTQGVATFLEQDPDALKNLVGDHYFAMVIKAWREDPRKDQVFAEVVSESISIFS